MKEKFLKYHGSLQSLKTIGSKVLFVTHHAEQNSGALYCLDAEKMELESKSALPCGGVELVTEKGEVWIAGTDHQLYHFTDYTSAPKVVKTGFEDRIVALTSTAKDLIVASEHEVKVLSLKGKIMETLSISTLEVSALGVSSCGAWIAIGAKNGEVCVYQREETKVFQLSSQAKLHNGLVSQILFDTEGSLRFLSTGLDGKMLYTHARGELEPEDRGRGAGHSDRVTHMISVNESRVLTSGLDASIKSWVKGAGTRPSTFDKIGKVRRMGVLTIYERPYLAVVCANNTLQLLSLKEGKIEKKFASCFDIFHTLEKELSAVDVRRKEAALTELITLNDHRAVKLIGAQIQHNRDLKLRVMATELLVQSNHDTALELLIEHFQSPDLEVRSLCFTGAMEHPKALKLKVLTFALKAGTQDISIQALEELSKDASESEESLALLISAINAPLYQIRLASLLLLEVTLGVKPPDSALLALQSKFADTRRDGIYRLYKNNLLTHPRALAALRANIDHKDVLVRDAVWYGILYTRPNLVKTLRSHDADLHRKLWEWETARPLVIVGREGKEKGAVPKKVSAKPRKTKVNLAPEDYTPLYQAMASRTLDISLNGAVCLAILGERKALGLLLQLSHSSETYARKAVCKALAHLKDSRAEERLLSFLYDKAIEVRDSAFWGLTQLYKSPLDVVNTALSAEADDVRLLGLQLLLKELKVKLPQSKKERSWQLLTFALQSPSEAVRLEAYKAVINLKLGGATASSLEFALQSVHHDIRREVLTELMARSQQEWAWDLLCSFFNDPQSSLRQESYTYALHKTKGKDESVMVAALGSTHADLRRVAVQSLGERKTKSSQTILTQAIEDLDQEVRKVVLQSLIDQSVEPALITALKSSFFDVQICAAQALAKSSSPKAKDALTLLLQQERPAKEHQEALKQWSQAILGALAGLELLGDASLVDLLLPFVDSPELTISQAAMRAVVLSCHTEQVEKLSDYLKHQDATIALYASYAFGLAGDRRGLPALTPQALDYISESQQITAALMLGRKEERPLYMIQLAERYHGESLRRLSRVMNLLDWVSSTPQFALASISAKSPDKRCEAAEFIATFSQHDQLSEYICQKFNTRDEGTEWNVSSEELESLAKVIQHASPHLVSQAIELLTNFHPDHTKQTGWNLEWSHYKNRYHEEVGASAKQELPKKASDPIELQELAFGAYLGLSREGGRKNRANVALRHLVRMGRNDAFLATQVASVCLQSLFDKNYAVRMTAFDGLIALEEDPNLLAEQCLESGHLDLGTLGLQLLAQEAGEQGKSVLEGAMLERRDDLSIEAAKLLSQIDSLTTVATLALGASYQPLRTLAVQWLAQESKTGAKHAQKALIKVASSDQYELRLKAIQALSRQKDISAFELITQALEETLSEAECRPLIRCYSDLGDPRAAEELIKRASRDSSSKALYPSLIEAASTYRQLDTASLLLNLSSQDAWRLSCYQAILVISGHDQYIGDDEKDAKERASFERDWLAEQYPRHDDLLATLISQAIEYGELTFVSELIEPASWALSSATNGVLDSLAFHESASVRQPVIEAIAFRFCYRDGPREVLHQALGHKDPMAQFLAAEGLALGGDAAGLSILLAAVELMDGLEYRIRAVHALGHLAHEKSFSLLLRLAGESEHALQSVAATALGHLQSSDTEGKGFQILKGMTTSSSSDKVEAAVRGLRYYDTAQGWQLLRGLTAHPNWWVREAVFEELQYNRDPATASLLIKELERNPSEDLLSATRKVTPPDSLEPDYAVLRGRTTYYVQEYRERCLHRVCERGDPQVMLELLETNDDNYRLALMSALSSRTISEAALMKALQSTSATVVQGAAQLLPKSAKALKVLTVVMTDWLAQLEKAPTSERCHLLLPTLFEALVKQGVLDVAIQFIETHEGKFESLRVSAMKSICNTTLSAKEKDWVVTATSDSNVDIRDLAVQTLTRSKEPKISQIEESLLYDARYYQQLHQASLTSKGSSFIDHPHYSGVVLEGVLHATEAADLISSVYDKDLSEAVKKNLIKGLASQATLEAEDALASLGKDKTLDEELCQTAWRARRKSMRLRLKKEGK